MATPTVRKLQLGNELRRLREAAGRSSAEAAKALDCAPGKISRLELGQSAATFADLKLLIEFYEADELEAERLVELSRDNRRRGRWTGHRSVFPEWFRAFVDLERDADDIKIAESEVVPGLFQTEPYMRMLYSATAATFDGPVDIEAAVRSRLERQEVLVGPNPPTVSCVMSESCVRRVVGDCVVMAEQMLRLVEVSERPRVRLQLWPFDGEVVGGTIAPRFTLLRIPAARAVAPFTFAYCEDLDDARYIDDESVVQAYDAAWGALQAAAIGPVDTRSRLRTLAKEFT